VKVLYFGEEFFVIGDGWKWCLEEAAGLTPVVVVGCFKDLVFSLIKVWSVRVWRRDSLKGGSVEVVKFSFQELVYSMFDEGVMFFWFCWGGRGKEGSFEGKEELPKCGRRGKVWFGLW